MNKPTIFDVLIVYSDRLADSAESASPETLVPFDPQNSHVAYNEVYGYFLKVCQDNNLAAAFTTSFDVTGPGRCSCYWQFDQNQWFRVNRPACARVIFDKFSPTNQRARNKRKLLFSSSLVKPFNNSSLLELFFDKYKTYQKLSDYAIPTVVVKNGGRENLRVAIDNLKELVSRRFRSQDFSGDIIMKDRFGAGGKDVYRLEGEQIEEALRIFDKNERVNYIFQPFVNFDKGYFRQGSYLSADIRLIFFGGKIIQTYIRTAKNGDFRCNESRGGKLKYLTKSEIPPQVIRQAQKITKILKRDDSLFTLDFLVANSGQTYLLEGNTSPGLDWDLSSEENETEAKKLIQIIVQELLRKSSLV